MKKVYVVIAFIGLCLNIQVKAQTINLKPDNVNIKWTGKKIAGFHQGSIQLKTGTIELKDSLIIKGYFVVNMNSIRDSDLTDISYNQKLVNHLKSADFFDVQNYPEASFQITKTEQNKTGIQYISGNLTIKGITHSIHFPVQKIGKCYLADINIDRSKYNVRYGSDHFFDNLGNRVIDNEFNLKINLAIEK